MSSEYNFKPILSLSLIQCKDRQELSEDSGGESSKEPIMAQDEDPLKRSMTEDNSYPKPLKSVGLKRKSKPKV